MYIIHSPTRNCARTTGCENTEEDSSSQVNEELAEVNIIEN